MCGINGIMNLDDVSAARAIVKCMNDRLAHRGPDDEGIFTGEGIALGHRRLSIIDLSSAGHQPMTSMDERYVIVYNGELYNFKQLKFDLQRAESGANRPAYLFKTNTDTEVILASYARWGTACLDRFIGMYAFAIWDRQKKELFIARDRLGIKPLYFFRKDDLLIFSSEIRALLASNLIPKKADRASLADYLRYQTVHAPATIVKDVHMLMPGHFILASETSFQEEKYWSAESAIAKEHSSLSYKETCKRINALFYAAVERRLVSDVPFGAFLSGGIDSSAVVAAMSKVAGSKVETFSVTFEENEFSEAKYAKLISEKFGTNHHEIKLSLRDFLGDLPLALEAMDHPSGDGPNTYVVSKATKRAGVTMALSGLGGDELFAGYDVFKRMSELRKKKWLNAVPLFGRNAAGSLLKILKPGIASEKKSALLALDKITFDTAYPLTRQVMMEKRLDNILRNSPASNKVEEIVSALKRTGNEQVLSRVSLAEMNTYMQNVLLRDTDQMSMAHALEVRVPFLDHELVEFVLGVPDKFKYPLTPKKLLIDAMGDVLPREIIDRPKMGFTFPFRDWMKRELKDLCRRNMKALSERECFNEQAVMELWEGFLKNDPTITWSSIWYLVVLEHWLQLNGIDE